MKKLLFTALTAVTLSLGAFAQNVDQNAVNNFDATFMEASNVQWISKENFTKASFIQDDKNL